MTDAAALRTAVQAAGPALDGLASCIGSIAGPWAGSPPRILPPPSALNATAAALTVQAAAPGTDGEAAGAAFLVVLFSSIAARARFPNDAVIGAAEAADEV